MKRIPDFCRRFAETSSGSMPNPQLLQERLIFSLNLSGSDFLSFRNSCLIFWFFFSKFCSDTAPSLLLYFYSPPGISGICGLIFVFFSRAFSRRSLFASPIISERLSFIGAFPYQCVQ